MRKIAYYSDQHKTTIEKIYVGEKGKLPIIGEKIRAFDQLLKKWHKGKVINIDSFKKEYDIELLTNNI